MRSWTVPSSSVRVRVHTWLWWTVPVRSSRASCQWTFTNRVRVSPESEEDWTGVPMISAAPVMGDSPSAGVARSTENRTVKDSAVLEMAIPLSLPPVEKLPDSSRSPLRTPATSSKLFPLSTVYDLEISPLPSFRTTVQTSPSTGVPERAISASWNEIASSSSSFASVQRTTEPADFTSWVTESIRKPFSFRTLRVFALGSLATTLPSWVRSALTASPSAL